VIDHIDGEGNQHRETVKHMYRWLKQQGYPPGFRISVCQLQPRRCL
jgi:hypothetical protein